MIIQTHLFVRAINIRLGVGREPPERTVSQFLYGLHPCEMTCSRVMTIKKPYEAGSERSSTRSPRKSEDITDLQNWSLARLPPPPPPPHPSQSILAWDFQNEQQIALGSLVNDNAYLIVLVGQ